MDLEPSTEPDPLAWLVEDPPPKPETVFTKETLLHSPLILRFLPHFKVDIHKPWTGLPSRSINDEREQLLHPPEADSFFGDDMSEDDDGEILWKAEESGLAQRASQIVPVSVIVKLGSLSINGIEFPFSSALRDAVLIPGGEKAEDSLLVSLKLGFLLLVRLYYMPKYASETSLHDQKPPDDQTFIYKPFVVQWWKTTSPATDSGFDMETSGAILAAHNNGLAVVSALAANVFRIYMCNSTELGLELLPHHNVPLEGNILRVCFGRSPGDATEENLLQLMTLSYSPMNRLEINLFQWYVSESFSDGSRRLTLPLTHDFGLPIFVIPLARNSSFLFIFPAEFVVVTAHNVILADYTFARFNYAGSFPTSFALPESDGIEDEIFLASDSGVIYSVVVSGDNSSLTYKPILRVADAITTFTLHRASSGYNLRYSNDAGSARHLHIPELLHDLESADKIPYSDALQIQDYKNWAPLVDICIIDAYKTRTQIPYASQELWAVSGAGKRSKLANLSIAYPLKKECKSYDALRKTTKIHFVLLPDSRKLLFASLPFETRLLELEQEESSDDSGSNNGDMFTEIEDPAIFTEEPTLFVELIPFKEPLLLQFTATSVTFSSLENCFTSRLEDKMIHQVSQAAGFLFMIVEQANKVNLEVVEVNAPDMNGSVNPEACLETVFSLDIDVDISTMFATEDGNGNGVLFLGTLEEKVIIWPFTASGGFSSEKQVIDLGEQATHKDRFPRDLLVPSAFLWLKNRRELLVGTFTGYCFRFKLENAFLLVQDLRLGTTPISFTHLEESQVLVTLRNIWLFDFEDSDLPTKAAFDEKISHAITLVAHVSLEKPGLHKLALVRDDGVTTASITCRRAPLVKQITIGEAAKKLLYLENINVFVLLCKSKDPQSRLRFGDRKTLRILASVEIDVKLGEQRETAIFDPSEFPICAFQWHVERNDRVSKKLIVGCSTNVSKGSIKILDYSKFPLSNSTVGIKVTELYSISRDGPVTCIEQIGLTIFFASGNSIYTTSYLLADRKLRPVNTIQTLSSDIASMTSEPDGRLIVSTKMDSVFEFTYDSGDSYHNEELKLVMSDKAPKSLANHVKIDDSIFIADKLFSTIHELTPRGVRKRDGLFKTHLIPRVFKTLAQGPWAESDRLHMLSVGVTGDVVAFDRIVIGSPELQQICQKLADEDKIPHGANFDVLYERLERPFLYKLTGKAFQGIYKPFFGNSPSKDLIDYDLEDLKRIASSSISL